jgi:mRNA-degrading endonuclease RelE of RelBE toxin-antitoxin system
MSKNDINLRSVGWRVEFTSKAAKQYVKLPEQIKVVMDALVIEIQQIGPMRGNWKNYGKLGPSTHHCHLKAWKPTYVACWEVIDKTIRVVEVYYVGTHEKAPY